MGTCLQALASMYGYGNVLHFELNILLSNVFIGIYGHMIYLERFPVPDHQMQ